MQAIEATGVLDAEGLIRLDPPLPHGRPRRVRVLMWVLDEPDAELEEQTWLAAVSTNPSFAFLHDPEEDIYSLGQKA
jgi:hypothetical protein